MDELMEKRDTTPRTTDWDRKSRFYLRKGFGAARGWYGFPSAGSSRCLENQSLVNFLYIRYMSVYIHTE